MADEDRTCAVCGRERGADATTLCGKCKDTLGVVAMKPSRRKPAPCGKCNGWIFVRVVPRQVLRSSEYGDVFAPMPLTFGHQLDDSMIMRAGVKAPSAHTARGVAEAFVCQACGFIEWYCQNPAAIPIGPQYMTELVDDTPDATSPYR